MIPKLVAHRGYMHKYPENSLLGLKMAMEAGACRVEFDVQMNAEHELIVVHDDDLQRTAGIAGSVFAMTTSELTKISVHEPARFGEKYLITPLPLLRQVLELVASYPKVIAFVEVKDESLTQWGHDCVMHALHEALKPYASQCVVISFNYDAIHKVKQQQTYASGWVVKNFDEVSHQKARELNPDYLICNETKISDNIEPWQGDWSWMLYDIIDPLSALKWAGRGVALIETEDIGGMLEHIELRKESC